MKDWKRIGYVSVELVITAALIMAAGFFVLLNFGTTGSQLMQNGMAKLDDLGIFGEGSNPPTGEGLIYDKNGYPADLNVNPADINPVSDFEMIWNNELDGWEIVAYLNASDKTVVIPKEDAEGKLIVKLGGKPGERPVDPPVIGTFFFMDIETIAIPNSIIEISDLAVMGNHLGSLIIPDSVKSIGEFAFTDNYLESVYIPKGVESIGAASFNWNLLPQDMAFIYASGTDKQTLVSYGGALKTGVKVPQTVETIGVNAFMMAPVKSVQLPNGLKVIEAYAFVNTNLNAVTIPQGVTTLGEGAFVQSALSSVIFKGDFPDSLGDFVFANNAGLVDSTIWVKNTELSKYQDNASKFAVPASAFYTGEWQNIEDPSAWYDESLNIQASDVNDSDDFRFYLDTFTNTYAIVAYLNSEDMSVVVPKYYKGKMVTKVSLQRENEGDFAFPLVSVALPNSIQVISSSAFHSNGLTDIIIPNSVERIEDYAFRFSNLTSVTIPNTVEYIGKGAFMNANISSLVIESESTIVDNAAFNLNNLAGDSAFIFTYESGEKVLASYGGKETFISVPDGTKRIGDYAFTMIEASTLSMPSGVERIGEFAFLDSSIDRIQIPASVAYLGSNAFRNSDVEEVTFFGDVPSSYVGNGIFRSTPNLMRIKVPLIHLDNFISYRIPFGVKSSVFYGY